MRDGGYSRHGSRSRRTSASTGNVRAQRGCVPVRYGCIFGADRFSCTSNDTANAGTGNPGTCHPGGRNCGARHAGAGNARARDGRADRESCGRCPHFGPISGLAQRNRTRNCLNGAEYVLRHQGHIQERPERSARPRPESLERGGCCQLDLEHRSVDNARNLADRRDLRRRERTRNVRRAVAIERETGQAGISCRPVTKILVSLDDKLLDRVDRSARRLGLSRGAYLARLVEHDLGTEWGPGRDPAVRRALADIDQLVSRNPQPPGFDLTESIRKMRDSRLA